MTKYRPLQVRTIPITVSTEARFALFPLIIEPLEAPVVLSETAHGPKPRTARCMYPTLSPTTTVSIRGTLW